MAEVLTDTTFTLRRSSKMHPKSHRPPSPNHKQEDLFSSTQINDKVRVVQNGDGLSRISNRIIFDLKNNHITPSRNRGKESNSHAKDRIKIHTQGDSRQSSGRASREMFRNKVKGKDGAEHIDDVKRKLKFETDDGLDFTDKISALRSVLGKESRNLGSITNRREYYKEDVHDRKSTASYSDFPDKIGKNLSVNANGRHELETGLLDTAMIDSRITDDRLSALTVDLYALKDRLQERRKDQRKDELTRSEKSESHKHETVGQKTNGAATTGDIKQQVHHNGKREGGPSLAPGDPPLHATPDRRVITPHRNSQSNLEGDILASDARHLGHKHTQTGSLNQSLNRSIQSNCPFYDPDPHVFKDTHGKVHSKATPSKHCIQLDDLHDNKQTRTKRNRLKQNKEQYIETDNRKSGSDSGACVDIGQDKHKSGKHLGRIKANSSVDDHKTSARHSSQHDLDRKHIEKYLSTRFPSAKVEDGLISDSQHGNMSVNKLKGKLPLTSSQNESNHADVRRLLNVKHERDTYRENVDDIKRRSSYKSQSTKTDMAGKLNSADNRRSAAVIEQDNVQLSKCYVELNNNYNDKNKNIDVFLDQHFDKRIILKTEKTEMKVREWIKQIGLDNPEPLSDSGPMTIDELSVSVSEHSGKRNGFQNGAISPTDSCDKIPVKLEKNKLEIAQKVVHLDQLNSLFPQKEQSRKKVKSVAATAVMKLPSQKDVLAVKGQKVVKSSLESDSESSVFSVPFSVQSGESVSTTCQAVKLLRRLSHVPPDQRQNLVLLAKCFRRWWNNVLHAKARDQQITEAARHSPISYGVMIRQGEICFRTSLLHHYFEKWKSATKQRRFQRAVSALQRRHLLQKGMNAFKWAINRSTLRQGILTDRVHSMLLTASFNKWRKRTTDNRRHRLQWRKRTTDNRRHRLQVAFGRWRQFSKEAQKIRLLRTQSELRLKQRLYQHWSARFHARQTEHRADAHVRMVMLTHGWISWRYYTVVSRDKKRRQKMAVLRYEYVLQKKTFTYIQVELGKYTKAKTYHRTCQLRRVLDVWRAGTQLSRTERRNDMLVAGVYWSRCTVRAYFTAWHDQLLARRACRMNDRVIVRHAFTSWTVRYQQLLCQREEIDAYVRHNIMYRTLRSWCHSVAAMKHRRQLATECLHAALQRHVLHRWHTYTLYQKDIRKRLQIHVRRRQLKQQKTSMAVWKANFTTRIDVQRAQQLWSNTCTRKAGEKWLSICHRRRLTRLLTDTEPVRRLDTQRVMFKRWRDRLNVIEDEKHEASEIRAILNLSQIQRCFVKWRGATEQLLKIKPMVLRYRQRLVSECFDGWREYVKHKAECSRSEREFATVQLRWRFAAWRRQYDVHQLEKAYNKRRVENQARRCLHGWRSVIQRKHAACRLHDRQLVQSAFYSWHASTLQQLHDKQMAQLQTEKIVAIQQKFFAQWRGTVLRRQSYAQEAIGFLQQQQADHRLQAAFYFWWRHFRATLVARENEKMRVRRLARQALQEWHRYTQATLTDAVQKFAAAIGLQGANSVVEAMDDADGQDTVGTSDEQLELMFEPLNLDLDMTPRSLQSPRQHSTQSPHTQSVHSPCTPRTPRHASSCATPLRRLFSPGRSRSSLAQSIEYDCGALLSSNFLDARFEMEHAVKTESRREIVTTAVTRLRHWPVSILFDQWKEYTARKSSLKLLATRMISVDQQLVTARFYRTWVKHYYAMRLAKQHYENVLQHKALLSLILYRNSRRQKTELSTLARGHYATKVYSKVFPVWLTKAQEKQQKEHILHLWSNITAEEKILIPRERSFLYRTNRKTLRVCLSQWSLHYRRVTRLKAAYHRVIVERCFQAWLGWALERHERRVKCDTFRDRRVTSLVFKTWCLRHTQRTEVARRYDDAWHNYMGTILQAWWGWARDQRKHKLLAIQVSQTRHGHLVRGMFDTWVIATQNQLAVQQWYEDRLTLRVMYGWLAVARWQREARLAMHQFQVNMYTRLAQQCFRQWRDAYHLRLAEKADHERSVQCRVLRMARVWRRKVQVSRGQVLAQHLQQQHMRQYFEKWRRVYNKHLAREGVLDAYLADRNSGLVSEYLAAWRTELLARQAQRVFNMRLLAAYTYHWRVTAREIRVRRASMVQFTARRAACVQRGYFLYWYNIAKARQSIRGHANLKTQLTVFKAWLVYTRKCVNLRRLEAQFTRRRDARTLHTFWYSLTSRFEYCLVLTETATKVVKEKNERLMRQALTHWDYRLKMVIAGECYQHLLARRVSRVWTAFVRRRKQERLNEARQMETAQHFYCSKLCRTVFAAWWTEVLVSRQVCRHKARLLVKYGRRWKHRVDMMFTAKAVRRENTLTNAWGRWHLEFVKRRSMHKVEAFQRKQTLTMVFVAWRNLCEKRHKKVSLIPLPVSPAFNMPTAGSSSGSTTPTDDPAPRPSQIPAPSARSRGRQLPPIAKVTAAGSGRSTPTGHSGRNRSSVS